MKKICYLLLASSFLWIGTVQAQKNAQGKVLYAIMEELRAAHGEEKLELMRRIKTEAQFANYMRMKAKGCHNCPVLQEFAKGLSAPPRQPVIVPGIGVKPAEGGQAKPSTNFGTKILTYYEYNIYGVDDDSEPMSKCGPFYGLSRWGCPLPCRGFCPKDPIVVPGSDEEDPDYEGDDEDYGDDYDYDSGGSEEEFNYDDYEPAGSNDYEYEYDPDF